MKNKYKKVIKLMDKSERVIISRYDGWTGSDSGCYIVTDGYVAIRVAPDDYHAFFMTEKPYYDTLDPGTSWVSARADRNHTTGGLKNDFADLAKLFPEDTSDVVITKYKKTAEKGVVADLFVGNGFVAAVNSDFVAAFCDIFGRDNCYGSGAFKPIYWNDVVVDGLTLPIRNQCGPVEEALMEAYQPDESIPF